MKKIISILICIQIALFPAFAFAANVGGWTLGGGVAQGASTVYDATKNVVINGKKFIKESSVKITPTATSVAKVLARGGAGYALSVAVEQLLGSVEWVLDPANNSIRYYEHPQNSPVLGKFRYRWDLQNPAWDCYSESDCVAKGNAQMDYAIANGVPAGNRITWEKCVKQSNNYFYCTGKSASGSSRNQTLQNFSNPAYDPNAEREEKSLPLETVAQKVISNAEAGNATAQAATTAAAADIVAEAEKDNAKARPIASQAEANANTKPADAAEAEKANEATGEAKPNTANPDATDLSITFPIFCNWAPTICEAAQTVISFPTTLTDWWNTSNQKADSWASSIAEAWTSVKEWATGEPDLSQDQTDLPIEEQTIDRDPSSFDTDYIVLGSQCPTFEPYTVEVGPVSKTLSMDLSPLCDFAAKVRPAILGMSYLTAAGIVVAAIRET